MVLEAGRSAKSTELVRLQPCPQKNFKKVWIHKKYFVYLLCNKIIEVLDKINCPHGGTGIRTRFRL